MLLIKNPKNILEIQQIITGLLTQNYDHKYISLYHSSKVKILSQNEIPWSLDGEYGGKHKDVAIKNNPESITLIVNKEIAKQ